MYLLIVAKGSDKREKDNVKNRQRNNILGFNQIFMIDVMK
jgi:hypothetical protein